MRTAILLQHPRAHVKFDPPADPTPQTPQSIAASYAFNCAAREEAGQPPLPPPASFVPSALYAPADPTPDQIEIKEVTDGLFNLIQKYGADRVARWVRNLATIPNQDCGYDRFDTDRPSDRCLADGAPLINSVCTRCGQDNS